MITDIIEKHLNTALQKNVQFMLNDKAVREGKLMLYNIKDFYITFTIMTKKDIVKTYEIPIPYSVNTSTDGNIVFSYKLDHLIKGRSSIEKLIDKISTDIGKKSKFFNNVLEIQSA